tara:strand:+ start:369 stop:980 length:612 start_codon:yes stop_codon:yes gene_type:complete
MNTDNVFFNFCHPIIKKLDEGQWIKLGFTFLHRVIAVSFLLIGLYALYNFFDAEGWKSFSYDENFRPVEGFNFGSVLFLFVSLFACWIAFQIAWFRATRIMEIANSRYVVNAIFSSFVRMIGEVMASIVVITATSAGVFSLFSDNLNGIIPVTEIGVAGIIAGPVLGFLIIAVSYFLAERISATPEIAVNTGVMNRSKSSPEE